MIIFAKICKSIVCKDFILQNVHPAWNAYPLLTGLRAGTMFQTRQICLILNMKHTLEPQDGYNCLR